MVKPFWLLVMLVAFSTLGVGQSQTSTEQNILSKRVLLKLVSQDSKEIYVDVYYNIDVNFQVAVTGQGVTWQHPVDTRNFLLSSDPKMTRIVISRSPTDLFPIQDLLKENKLVQKVAQFQNFGILADTNRSVEIDKFKQSSRAEIKSDYKDYLETYVTSDMTDLIAAVKLRFNPKSISVVTTTEKSVGGQ